MLLPWLQATDLSFNFHMRLNGLQYGMTATHLRLRTRVYWTTFNTATLLVAMENGPKVDPAAAELVFA